MACSEEALMISIISRGRRPRMKSTRLQGGSRPIEPLRPMPKRTEPKRDSGATVGSEPRAPRYTVPSTVGKIGEFPALDAVRHTSDTSR